MHNIRKRRLFFIIFFLMGISLILGLSLFVLRKNIDLYYTPTEALKNKIPLAETFRLGGVVVKNSVHHDPGHLTVHFGLTDFHHQITVKYSGILPSLFREGQGIVAEGCLNAQGIFMANTVLAKHDANYRPK